ncbi:protein broad-minded isoform X2 [Diachasma alloeum]|uniref:protein broad-minded isoform X2 n=1 Tax=Diachasma alloeum TaxID=454923 RepID=UPI0007385175|nr:protein broad-minded isoform X2 [Diachasma alloeum]
MCNNKNTTDRMSEMNMSLRKWVKKYIKERFNDDIEKKLNDGRGEGARERKESEGNETKIILQLIANEMVKSREIGEIIAALKKMKNTTDNDNGDDDTIQGNVNLENIEENFQSYRSDDLSENWDGGPLLPSSSQMEGNNLFTIFDEISMDKPVHVRLGGFETLFESDLSNNCNSEAFEQLLKLLKDGIADTTKAVFEASLRIHAKLLNSPRSHDVYTNLINAFEAEYRSEKSHESLPNFGTGINFKIFIHEKLLRILHVIVRFHKEMLKNMRIIDRTMEEMIDQFFVLLMYNENKKNSHCKNLSPLNLVSVLEPHANWSEKWIYSVGTRKFFISAVSKSPILLQTVCEIVQKGLEQATFNGAFAYSIKDDVIQSMSRSVYISGDTVETITYLHCLNFMAQINNCFNGASSNMALGYSIDLPLSSGNFTLALINSLNSLATSTIPKTIYNGSQHALKLMLDRPTCLFDSSVGNAALIPLKNFIAENNGNLWPHTIDLINFMLDSGDGLSFFTSQYRCTSPDELNSCSYSATPAASFLNYTSTLLRQPIALMNIDHVIQILELVGKLFHIIENFSIIYKMLENELFPSIEYFYKKIQKYSIRHENNSQLLDSAIQEMLLKIVAWPLGLQLLTKNQLTLEELIRGSINPFRHSWSSNEIISFISSVSYFDAGCKLMVDLVPHTVSMLLDEINDNMDNEENLADLRDCEHVKKFIHVLSLFSHNTKCFLIFMMDEDSADDYCGYPRNLCQLFNHAITIDSSFHYISLLSLETVIWNLDILIYLLNRYNLQSKLLQLQESCLIEVTKYKDSSQDEGNEEFNDSENYTEENKIEEFHQVHLIDESSMLRNSILSKSYFIRHKLEKLTNYENPDKCTLYSSFPPPTLFENNDVIFSSSTSESPSSELEQLLHDCKPGLRDSGWVMQIRNAHGNSPGPMKHSTYLMLLDQMERAIAAVEWIDMYKWDDSKSTPSGYQWLPEEDIGLNLVIRFSEDHWENSNNKLNIKDDLKLIFESVHKFIKYQRSEDFEAFDWFLGTIFIICDGNLDRCKHFAKNIVRFPSAIYMWNFHGISHGKASSVQTLTTQFVLAQQIDSIVIQEFPEINYAMMNEWGIKWWMICNRFLSQCFWGVLEWSEIIHFLAICILYPPDHIVYYCISLLQHCEAKIMQDIVDKKYWPENIARFE